MSQSPRDADPRATAERTAGALTAASRDVEEFLRRIPTPPTPADLAEYATLIAREEAFRRDRDAALDALGLRADSIGTE